MSAVADPDDWRNWDPKSQDELARMLEQRGVEPAKAWYCTRGRTCDGQPHTGFDYPHARGDQWPPEGVDWEVWLLSGGRGSGKTRSGAEWTRKVSTRIDRLGILGPTVAHVRDVMVEGDSGLMYCFDRAKVRARWEPSKRKITILGNDHIISTYSGEEPELLRGRQHAGFWLDEPAHIPLIDAVWDNLLLGLRLGKHPRVLCSTTPLPIPWIIALEKDPATVTVRVSTYTNLSNLAPTFRKAVLNRYEGTRLGRQELHGEVLTDVLGALWNYDMIEPHRVHDEDHITAADMTRIYIGIDPSGTSSRLRDECGIIAVGQLGRDYYVLNDSSGTYTPDGWARAAYAQFDELGADKIIAEKNYGGEMVLTTLNNYRKNQGFLPQGETDLVHSRRGKELRAAPVVGLYEQGRVHHLTKFETLETQMTSWVPGTADSPDRVDALVHAILALGGGELGESSIARPAGPIRPLTTRSLPWVR